MCAQRLSVDCMRGLLDHLRESLQRHDFAV
jgi:hypothetical protein